MTIGDPAGVGPELALRAWLARDAASPAFFVLADPAGLADIARRLDLAAPIAEVAPGEAVAAFPRALPVVPLAARADARPARRAPTSPPRRSSSSNAPSPW